MCLDPVSLTTVALTAVGGLTSAVSKISNARSQANALEDTAAQQEQAAFDEIEQGREDADRRRRAGHLEIGEQRAALAANGIDVDGQVALDLLDDSQSIIDQDAFSIRENARRGGQASAQNAANSLTQASNTRSQGTFGSFNTILSSGSKIAPQFKGKF